MSSISHRSLSLLKTKKLIYTAFSKHYFYYRMFISRFVLKEGRVPLNPFMIFDYFLLDSVDRDTVRQANNSILCRSDEVWVFGPVSDGVLAEILIAKKKKKPISFYQIRNAQEIVPVGIDLVEMEKEVQQHKKELQKYF